MKVQIEFEIDDQADLAYVLGTLNRKIAEQSRREDGCVCTAPESADLLRNLNGNIVGTVEVQ